MSNNRYYWYYKYCGNQWWKQDQNVKTKTS